MNGSWISVKEELPPKDGIYEVTNHPDIENNWTNRNLTILATYDGYGFEYLGIYRFPRYWRKYELKEKRYGKLENK